MTNDPNLNVNLYLVGFMGTGKSVIGRQLAKAMKMKFFDSDSEIVKIAGKPIKNIFADEGESVFRKMEREFVVSGHPETGCIIACGGGLIMQEGVIEILKSKGVLICLFASAETILKRTSSNLNRPLLNVDSPKEKIDELLAERESTYLQAGTGIYTDNRSISEIVEHALRIYRKQAAMFS